jgi:hypothetical protein
VGSSPWWPRLLAGSDPPLPSSYEEITDKVAYVKSPTLQSMQYLPWSFLRRRWDLMLPWKP